MDDEQLRNILIQKYNTTFEITYINPENENIDDDLYQKEFLQAFNLDVYDDLIIDTIQTELFQLLKNNTRLLNICSKLASNAMCSEPEYGFIFLFSYSYFYLTHKYICSILNSSYYDEQILRNLEELTLLE